MHTKDVTWIRPDGSEMTEQDWADPELHTIGMLLLGLATDEVDIRGRSYAGDSLFLMLNAGTRSRSYTLPRMELAGQWEEVLNTAQPGPWSRIVRTDAVSLNAHSTLSAATLRAPPRMTSAASLGSTYRLQLNGLGFSGRASARAVSWTGSGSRRCTSHRCSPPRRAVRMGTT